MKKPKINKFLNESLAISTLLNGIKIQKLLNQKLKIYDLNIQQALILLAIYFEDESKIRAVQLESILTISKGNISHCTSYLEGEKLIIRKLLKEDLRGFEFILTSHGKKICLSLINIFEKLEQTNDRKFTKNEREIFFKVLNNLE